MSNASTNIGKALQSSIRGHAGGINACTPTELDQDQDQDQERGDGGETGAGSPGFPIPLSRISLHQGTNSTCSVCHPSLVTVANWIEDKNKLPSPWRSSPGGFNFHKIGPRSQAPIADLRRLGCNSRHGTQDSTRTENPRDSCLDREGSGFAPRAGACEPKKSTVKASRWGR